MPQGKDFTSLEQAKSENLATAKKMISALEMMEQTGEVFGREFFRGLLLDTANANIRYIETLTKRVAELESLVSGVGKS